MEIKQIAQTIMELWQMDGYKDNITPSYYSRLNHTRTHTALIVSIGQHYQTVEMFRKTPLMSMRGNGQPQHMIANVIDDIIIIIYENTVYGVKNNKIKFIEEI